MIIVPLAAPGTVRAADPREILEESASIIEPLQEIGNGFDWEREHGLLDKAITKIWDDQQWNDESDRYARELVSRITAVPPWDIAGRMNVFSNQVARRYGLTIGQKRELEQNIAKELGGLLRRHGGVIVAHVREYLLSRGTAAPFTPEQVARWVRESEPLAADVEEIRSRFFDRLAQMVPEQHRGTLERDIAADQRRQAVITRMIDRWAGGQWRPEDWGLDEDPIQTGAEALSRGFSAVPTPRRVSVRPQRGSRSARYWFPHEPATWKAYIEYVQKRYHFDPGQCTAAESIHDELMSRVTEYMESRKNELRAVPPNARAKSEAYQPIVAVFDELRARLSSLPTSAQRERASADSKPRPAKRPSSPPTQ